MHVYISKNAHTQTHTNAHTHTTYVSVVYVGVVVVIVGRGCYKRQGAVTRVSTCVSCSEFLWDFSCQVHMVQVQVEVYV